MVFAYVAAINRKAWRSRPKWSSLLRAVRRRGRRGRVAAVGGVSREPYTAAMLLPYGQLTPEPHYYPHILGGIDCSNYEVNH